MKSWRDIIVFAGWSFLLPSLSAQAQVTVQGQVFLPTGQPIQRVTRLIVTPEDGRDPPQFYFTDGQGRFILRGLVPLRPYTITIESDGRSFGTTTVSFHAMSRGYVPVNLLPLEKEPPHPPQVVSTRELTHPPSPQALKLYEEALRHIEKKNFAQAEKQLRRAIELDPNLVNAYNELAVLQMGKKDYAAAVSLLRQALEKDPDALYPLLNLGISLNYLTRHQEAIAPLTRVLETNPDLLVAHVHLGIALLETDRLKDAEEHLVRGTTAEGQPQALAYLYLGKLYAQMGDVPKAVAAWKSYLQLDPTSPNAQRVRELLVRLGYPPEGR